MNNVAYIFQPHFKTNMFRVYCREQQGEKANYVVVTCSPSYNGVWKWDSEERFKLSTWTNNKLTCYCVPIDICTKVKELSEVTNEEVLKNIKIQQDLWENKEVTI